MFLWIRGRLTFVNLALTLAIVFAMSGGAYAASKYIITSTKQISPKVLKALQGKAGKAGANGAQGSQGAQGPQGPPGSTGQEGKIGKEGIGKEGKEGKEGSAGTSVASATLTKGNSNCKEGGSEFTAAGSKTYACDGSPWVAGGTLPAGATETGTWAASGMPAPNPGLSDAEMLTTSISFTIPLAAAPKVTVIETSSSHGAGGGTCPTTSSVEKPEAEPGNVCIFVQEDVNLQEAIPNTPSSGDALEAGPTGVALWLIAKAKEGVFVDGTWAVTAPS